mmetsp:Transcript_36518/g.97262  ORF Transcript_36518/g.97262 Transcript_36518/m.97262 type:complete len:101 (+) Transcript_36518:659-961(+)
MGSGDVGCGATMTAYVRREAQSRKVRVKTNVNIVPTQTCRTHHPSVRETANDIPTIQQTKSEKRLIICIAVDGLLGNSPHQYSTHRKSTRTASPMQDCKQ